MVNSDTEWEKDKLKIKKEKIDTKDIGKALALSRSWEEKLGGLWNLGEIFRFLIIIWNITPLKC